MAQINKEYFLGYSEGYDVGKMEAEADKLGVEPSRESLGVIREKLRILYVRGVYDGIDMVRGSDDRFKGNASARTEWEDECIIKTYQDIVGLLKV